MIKKIMVISLSILLLAQANHVPAVIPNRTEIVEDREEPPPERV